MELLRIIAARLGQLHKLRSPWSSNCQPPHLRAYGDYGELCALSFLRSHGLKFLYRHFVWHRKGEIDLVMRDGKTLVFIEVKTRRSREVMSGVSAVDHRKREHMRDGARAWVRMLGSRARQINVRFDIVEVIAPDSQVPQICWLRAAFTQNSNDKCRLERIWSKNVDFLKKTSANIGDFS